MIGPVNRAGAGVKVDGQDYRTIWLNADGRRVEIIDQRWREHLYDMDYLREGIHLRGFAQIDPLVAYKNEGFAMFEELMHSIWEEFSKLVFNAQIEIDPSQVDGAFAANGGDGDIALDYSGGTLEANFGDMDYALTNAGGTFQPGVATTRTFTTTGS